MSFGAHKDDDTLPIMTTTRNGQTDRRTDRDGERESGRGRRRDSSNGLNWRTV